MTDAFAWWADEVQIGVPDHVVILDCSKDIAKQRVLARKYNTRNDNEETFEQRFAEFRAGSADILAHFQSRGKLLKVSLAYVYLEQHLTSCRSTHSVLRKNHSPISSER